MSAKYEIVIIGSGPAGLSAAVRAAALGKSHILLERAPHLSDTIRKYFKGKLVMASPSTLRLRSDMQFQEARREAVLAAWETHVADAGVEYRTNCEVTEISGCKNDFEITLSCGDKFSAGDIIIAVGLQGNVRQLDIPGADLAAVSYQLDDPEEFKGKDIVVIGNGDAAIETALALSDHNSVTLANRRSEFPLARVANRKAIEAAIRDARVAMIPDSNSTAVVWREDNQRAVLTLATRQGERRIECDHIIARIGAEAPRSFIERTGIAFASDLAGAKPILSEKYESLHVPGLYVVGALAGYPLIKQCLNQGYDVVEWIAGRNIGSVQDEAIETMLSSTDLSGSELVRLIQEHFPCFRSLTPLQIRDYVRPPRSLIHQMSPGDIACRRGDYAESVYWILRGEVGVVITQQHREIVVKLGAGDFFGEMALLSGRRRTRTVKCLTPCLLLEIDRNTMLHLVDEVPDIKTAVGEAAAMRYIKSYFATELADDTIVRELVGTPEIVRLARGEVLIREGGKDDDVYLIERGSVTISQVIEGEEKVLTYLPVGSYVGEMAAHLRSSRTATVRAAVPMEAVKITSNVFEALLTNIPGLRTTVDQSIQLRLAEQQRARLQKNSPHLGFLLGEGLSEATDALLIDQSMCVGCNNCEDACAETHDGISRLHREAGPTFGILHVPVACRHCEDPHCAYDCPPRVISRAPSGKIVIDEAGCIHCGTCADACPYGAIQMVDPLPKHKSSFWRWLLFGSDTRPGVKDATLNNSGSGGNEYPIKCDACSSVGVGDADPACVRACPTGAAFRINFEHYVRTVGG